MTMLQTIEGSILEIRGVPAILDSTVAALYEVETFKPYDLIMETAKMLDNKVIRLFLFRK